MNSSHVDTGKSWKISIFGFIGLFVAATVASLVVAGRNVSRVVDTEYYNHGLHYAETHSRKGNAGKEWTMNASLVGNHLQVVVQDEVGMPVTGGRLVYNLDRGTGGRLAGNLQLSESSPGMYRTLRPDDGQSELRGIMRFTRGEATIVGKVTVIN
ncbi:MAG: FixH family protein [Desulfuromonadales bacterium]